MVQGFLTTAPPCSFQQRLSSSLPLDLLYEYLHFALLALRVESQPHLRIASARVTLRGFELLVTRQNSSQDGKRAKIDARWYEELLMQGGRCDLEVQLREMTRSSWEEWAKTMRLSALKELLEGEDRSFEGTSVSKRASKGHELLDTLCVTCSSSLARSSLALYLPIPSAFALTLSQLPSFTLSPPKRGAKGRMQRGETGSKRAGRLLAWSCVGGKEAFVTDRLVSWQSAAGVGGGGGGRSKVLGELSFHQGSFLDQGAFVSSFAGIEKVVSSSAAVLHRGSDSRELRRKLQEAGLLLRQGEYARKEEQARHLLRLYEASCTSLGRPAQGGVEAGLLSEALCEQLLVWCRRDLRGSGRQVQERLCSLFRGAWSVYPTLGGNGMEQARAKLLEVLFAQGSRGGKKWERNLEQRGGKRARFKDSLCSTFSDSFSDSFSPLRIKGSLAFFALEELYIGLKHLAAQSVAGERGERERVGREVGAGAAHLGALQVSSLLELIQSWILPMAQKIGKIFGLRHLKVAKVLEGGGQQVPFASLTAFLLEEDRGQDFEGGDAREGEELLLTSSTTASSFHLSLGDFACMEGEGEGSLELHIISEDEHGLPLCLMQVLFTWDKIGQEGYHRGLACVAIWGQE